jgi:alpha-glucosidase (family GH31 glycosyl hydrolase)
VDVSLNQIPVYVCEGTILPLAQAVQQTGELSEEVMTFLRYPDEGGAAAYTLIDGGQTRSIQARESVDGVRVSVTPELNG